MANAFETVDGLADDCQAFAELNERYAAGDSKIYERSYGTEDRDGLIAWGASMSAQRFYEGGLFRGHSFEIALNCQTEVEIAPATMRLAALDQKEALPEDKDIMSVKVECNAVYSISHHGNLSWEISRDYAYVTQEVGDGPTDTEGPLQVQGWVEETVGMHRAPEWKYDDDTAVEDEDILLHMETAIHVQQARKIFRMVTREELGEFDLAEILSDEVVMQLGVFDETPDGV